MGPSHGYAPCLYAVHAEYKQAHDRHFKRKPPYLPGVVVRCTPHPCSAFHWRLLWTRARTATPHDQCRKGRQEPACMYRAHTCSNVKVVVRGGLGQAVF
jgi:hypothetical protein